jgi:hypothetical protein
MVAENYRYNGSAWCGWKLQWTYRDLGGSNVANQEFIADDFNGIGDRAPATSVVVA